MSEEPLVSRGELDAVVRQLDAALARIEVLEQATAPAATTAEGTAHDAEPVDRRRFLNRAALAAGGAAAGAMVSTIAQPGVAAAADTDPLIAGGINTSTTRTVLQTTGDLEYGLGVHEAGLSSFSLGAAVAGQAKDHYDAGVLGMGQGNRTGVAGTAQNGIAVYAVVGNVGGPSGLAVLAEINSPTANGILASTVATYVEASAPYGIKASSGNGAVAAVVEGSRPLLFRSRGTFAPPPSRAGQHHLAGQLAVSSTDTSDLVSLWLCTQTGTPGTWRKISGPDTAGAFHVLPSTIRIYDSRPDKNPASVTKGVIGSNQTRTIDAKLGGAVPAGATAALVNLTIVDTSDAGFLALHKNGIPWPGNSSINWSTAGTVLANSAVVALDDQARLAVKCSTSSSTHVVIDAIGYYR